MGKFLFITACFLLPAVNLFSQIGLGITTPHPNAYFQVNSNNKGVLLPRMTAAQRLAIAPAAGATGLLVFDTDSVAYMYWSGSGWVKMVNSTGGDLWKALGTDIYNGNTGNVGIGTIVAPAAKLQVLGGSFLANYYFPANPSPAAPPVSGPGRRMMWYLDKAAFRSGYVADNYWDKDSIGNYSFAAGYNTEAKGEGSVSIGSYNISTGSYSGSFGYNNSASGQYSVSLGGYNAAPGNFGAMATGFSTTASGNASFSSGSSSVASGSSSFALGNFSTASGSMSIAGGEQSVASGQGAVALGRYAAASGLGATSLGSSSNASGGASFAANSATLSSGYSASSFGIATTAKAYGAFSAGVLNDDSDSPDPNTASGSDRIFQVGNGYYLSGLPYRYNALTILRNGNVGLNNTSPNAPLEFSISYGKKISLLPAGGGECGIGVEPNLLQVYTPYSGHDIGFGVYNSGVYTENVRFRGDGRVGIGTAAPLARMGFDNSVGAKISLGGTSAFSQFGFGVQSGLLQLYVPTSSDNIVFGTGFSDFFTEKMRIQGNGYVGIGNNNPQYLLDVSGRTRIRSGGNLATTSGTWLNNMANDASPAFIGLENDNSVGFYGSVAGWAFTMNTSTGKVKIADGTQAAGLVLTSDAAGTASWMSNAGTKSILYGVFSSGVNLTTAMGNAYTNCYFDLPPGKYLMMCTFLLVQGGSGGSMTAGQSQWVRFSLSNSSLALVNPGDIIGNGTFSGAIGYSYPYASVDGRVVINNVSGTTKRYYIWANMANTGGQPVGFALNTLGGNFWSENQLMIIPVN